MTNDKPTDYAAIIRAANAKTPAPPNWLELGKRIYAPNYGVGEVISLLGKRLIVKFPKYSIPVQFKDWSLSLQANEISPEPTTQVTSEILQSKLSQSSSGVNIAQIPPLKFWLVKQAL
jgi:DEAD/DEAH box helicase domain-containing protein